MPETLEIRTGLTGYNLNPYPVKKSLASVLNLTYIARASPVKTIHKLHFHFIGCHVASG